MKHNSVFRLTAFVVALLLLGFFLSSFVGADQSVDEPDLHSEIFTSIKKYAELANVSYATERRIKDSVSASGEKFTYFGNLPNLQVSFFMTTNDKDKTHTIAVRGTANIENALVDIDIKLVDDEVTGVRIHKGFASAAAGILEKLQPKIKKNYKITLTGHSLGGAVAQVLAMYLDVKDYKVNQVVTFGQPKVTNITGTLKFQHLKITRVVTPKDLVPLVPPLDPLDINKLDIYWHAGEEMILLNSKDYSLTSGVQSMLRATKIFNDNLSPENLQHHKMSQYLIMVSTRVGDANEIPYKNDFSGLKSLIGLP